MDLLINIKFFSIRRTISISQQWIRFAIISAVILASLAIAFWGSPIIYILLLVLLGGVGVMLALLKQPNWGFLLIFLGGMFVPIVGPSGLSAGTVMVALMLGLWIMDMFVVRKNVALVRTSVMVPIITFLVIAILAFMIGQVPWFIFARQAPLTAQVGGFAVFIFSIGGLLLAANLIKDVRWLKIITYTFLVLVGIYVLGRAVRFPLIDRIFHYGSTSQSMFWTWPMALAVGQLIFNTKLTRRTWWFLVGLVAVTMYVAIFQGFDWKSGWVPAFIAIAVLLAIRYRNLVVFAIPFIALIGIYVVFDLIAADDYSWGTRVDAWRIVLEISRVSPLLGMGFANYYWYTPLFPIRGWRVSFNSHSQFVDLIAQTGYLGLLSYFWLFFELGRLSWTVARKLPDGFARGYAYGVLAGIVATQVAAFLGDWVLPFVYNVGLTGFRSGILPWIFIGGVIALEQMLRDSSTAPANRFE